MKEKFIIFLFVFIIFFQVVSAATITTSTEFLKGENFIARISGNFMVPPAQDKVFFYRGHVSTSMGFYEIYEIEGDYYVSTQIPLEKLAGNYSIVIENSLYKNGLEEISDDIVGNFSILNRTVPFLVSPGLQIAEGNYSIKLTNLEPEKITISYGGDTFWEETYEKSLLSGESEIIFIRPKSWKGFQQVNFTYENETYSILSYIPKDLSEETSNGIINSEDNFSMNDGGLNETNEELSFLEKLFGKKKITEDSNKSSILDQGNDSLKMREGNSKNCSEMGYVICSEGEKCEGETEYGRDAKCCKGDCIKIEKSSLGKTIGWIIIIVLAFVVTWFLKKKYQETKTSPEKLLKN